MQGQTKSCSGYELTKARLHCETNVAGAEVPKNTHCSGTHIIEPEVLSFVLDFIHHPDTVQYSSYTTASCEGKSKSWVSELLGGGQKPVMWIKQNRSRMYQRYKQERIMKGKNT